MIVKAFTESDGLKTYLLKGIMGSRKGKLKVAYFQPLMQLEIVATHRNKGTMETFAGSEKHVSLSNIAYQCHQECRCFFSV